LTLTSPPEQPPAAQVVLRVPRSTVADTWEWLWKDTLGRLLPFALASAAYARFSGAGLQAIGLTGEDLGRDLVVGVALGVPMLGTAIAFRAWDAPAYRVPTVADQTLQSAFYFALNAPIEELFWRGTVQNLSIRALGAIPTTRPVAGVLGWAFTTAIFGGYHRLGSWRWRSIAGVTAAGGLFGALYLLSPRRSILAPILVHGFATAGFLSWGDAALHRLTLRRWKRQLGGGSASR
jgi:hypothetical protein